MPRPRPPSFADACARVVSDPDAAHSVTTTLAPLQARLAVTEAEDRRTDARFDLLRRTLPADVERVAEFGCGTGTLLSRLDDEYDAVGVDSAPGLLAFAAARGGSVVCGDPARPPLRAAFDAVCSFEHLGANRPLSALSEAAYATLRPGGLFVFDALSDPQAAATSGVETYRTARYVLERSVDVARRPPVVHADYRVTDLRTGEVGVTSERLPFRVDDAESIEETLESAGFVDVSVSDDGGTAGEVVGSAVRPIETSE
ncbi:class I SAM-dependent DNA methyltransferase [Halogeometricum limi]|uniref:Methyltransferase domain-containing protein n=1 Tax=Halogeometricum limi TaxID=555875 RepID=A0A1I6I2J7_9EURY|nr:class I SAM-dependent methyltransferase [Halogeometricum limi]SFR60966.1 Methyltransferase domain-containing protein [Halogeometricum limi]